MIFMKCSLYLLVLLIFSICIIHAQRNNKYFRKDYKYIEATESFYKFHTISRTWIEARERCEMEGASLFYPRDTVEADAVVAYWKGIYSNIVSILIGISDLVAKEVFETVDGLPITDVYENWAPYEPNNAGGVEDCVTMNYNKQYNDDMCSRKFQFICKKKLDELQWNEPCNSPYTEYIFSSDLNRCYKFHLNPRNWTEAALTCHSEQSYLAVVNNQDEADYLVSLTTHTSTEQVGENYLKGFVHLGFHSRDGRGWRTSKAPLSGSGYSKWGKKQPNGSGVEQCGAMEYNGLLNDVHCSDRAFFICEHEISAPRPAAPGTHEVTIKACDNNK